MATDELRLAGIIRESIVDGPGIRFVVFCQGCPHHCNGCHNPETHDFEGGSLVKIDKIVDAIKENPLLKGVTFSGGEPVCQAEGFYNLAKKISKLEDRKLDIVMYSGYTIEQLREMEKTDGNVKGLLENIDYLIDGKYVEEERDLTLQFRGSKNQRIIEM